MCAGQILHRFPMSPAICSPVLSQGRCWTRPHPSGGPADCRPPAAPCGGFCKNRHGIEGKSYLSIWSYPPTWLLDTDIQSDQFIDRQLDHLASRPMVNCSPQGLHQSSWDWAQVLGFPKGLATCWKKIYRFGAVWYYWLLKILAKNTHDRDLPTRQLFAF